MREFYKNKKILITGSSGFVGSWLAISLQQMGAAIYGIGLEPDTSPSIFKLLNLEEKIKQKYIDICDYKKLSLTINEISPDIVFHLAAQPLVIESYIKTIDTARLISKSLATGRCKIPFLFIYQPYQIPDKVPELFGVQVHSNIKSYAISSKDGIDVSDSLNEYQKEYVDQVHLSQYGRKIVAQKIFESNAFIEAVKSCKK